ncbi:MAG: hypothetical protein ACRCS7_14000 [Tannerellaceae bacterium]
MRMLIKATKLFVLIGCAVVGVVVTACNQKKETKKELFERTLEANVTACAELTTQHGNVDTAVARSFCKCMLTKCFEIDSNFVMLKSSEVPAFVKKHKDALEGCDAILLKHLYPGQK